VDEYDGRQYVGIDLHRRRSVIVRMTEDGQRIGRAVRIDNDPFELSGQVASWGESGGGAGGDVRLVLGGRRAG
jgi:hypothetical protein